MRENLQLLFQHKLLFKTLFGFRIAPNIKIYLNHQGSYAWLHYGVIHILTSNYMRWVELELMSRLNCPFVSCPLYSYHLSINYPCISFTRFATFKSFFTFSFHSTSFLPSSQLFSYFILITAVINPQFFILHIFLKYFAKIPFFTMRQHWFLFFNFSVIYIIQTAKI